MRKIPVLSCIFLKKNELLYLFLSCVEPNHISLNLKYRQKPLPPPMSIFPFKRVWYYPVRPKAPVTALVHSFETVPVGNDSPNPLLLVLCLLASPLHHRLLFPAVHPFLCSSLGMITVCILSSYGPYCHLKYKDSLILYCHCILNSFCSIVQIFLLILWAGPAL